MKKYILIFLIIFQYGFSQIQFEAKVSKQKLGLNERLQVDFTMNVDGDNFALPTFDGFKVIGGPFQQISQQWINGRGTFNKVYSYVLLPAQKGNLTIKSAQMEYNGQIYRTAPVKITVTNAVQLEQDPYQQQQQQQAQAPPSADKDLHLIAEISKTSPYINEPISVVYKLYFSNNIGISNSQEVDKPKYNDFWSQNIDIKKLTVEQGKWNGQNYRFVVLKKVVLYPQKAGKLQIDPLALELDLQIPTGRYNIFGEPQIVETTKRVSAGAKIIAVKALPEAGKPIDFTGAVGNFRFSAVPTRKSVKHGESLDLIVKVEGTGNLKLFDLPKPIVPSALEMYDPVHSEQLETPLSGTNGKIEDKYTIIPQYKGNYPIKPMTFSYFDLGSNTYKTITSPEIMINVLDGPNPGDPVAAANPKAKNALTPNDQFQYIKLKTSLVSTKTNDFLGSGTFYALTGLPFLCIPLLMFYRRRKEALDGDVLGNKIRNNNRLAKKYLGEAKKEIANKEAFYIALEKAMHNFLKAKLNIETSEMSKDKISELLNSKNANATTVTDFINLTENCEFARYTPASSGSIQQDYDKAVAIISDLEKQIS